MTKRRHNSRLKPLRTCFLNADAGPKNETRVTVVGHNPAHEQRIVDVLVEHYGWSQGHDGTLYPANPVVRSNAA